jgi:hypothetical protein
LHGRERDIGCCAFKFAFWGHKKRLMKCGMKVYIFCGVWNVFIKSAENWQNPDVNHEDRKCLYADDGQS